MDLLTVVIIVLIILAVAALAWIAWPQGGDIKSGDDDHWIDNSRI